MHRFQHKVILVVWLEGLNEWLARAMRLKTSGHHGSCVESPLAEIVVYVNDGNTGAPAPPLKLRETVRHRQGILQDSADVRELEMIDNVEEPCLENRGLTLLVVDSAESVPAFRLGL